MLTAAQPAAPVSSSEGYRPDIDGLRAVGVLGVLWYHSGLPSYAGLYSGVDVFFVVSGYLIAGQVRRELDAGTFTLTRFYQRRVRRIAPGLLAALIATLVAGYVVLLPDQLVGLARSALASLALIPNIFFWYDTPAGYFEALKRSPPALLHLWTLGIEEQFYLIFPLFLWIAHRFRLIRAAIVAVAIGSYALSAVVASRDPAAAFYLIPTRAWEFAVGALLSAGGLRIPQRWRTTTSLAGLALIGVAFVLLDDTSRFAALLLAIPVTGAALLIGSGPAAPANRLIATPPLVWIGRISFSLYLLHWPIIVLLQAPIGADRLSPTLAFAAIGAAIALAAASFYLIEQPARRRTMRFRTVAIASVAGVGVVLALALAPIVAGGLPARFSPQSLAIAAQSEDRAPLAHSCLATPLERIERDCRMGQGSAHALIWGDSHAAADSAGIAAGIGQAAVLAAMGGCAPVLPTAADADPDRCVTRNRAVVEWLNARPQISTVVLVANWTAHRRGNGKQLWAGLAATVAALPGRSVIIVAGTPDPQVDVPVVGAIRDHLGLSPPHWACPPARIEVHGAAVIDVSAAFCAYPQPRRLFTDRNHPSMTANRDVIAPAVRRFFAGAAAYRTTPP